LIDDHDLFRAALDASLRGFGFDTVAEGADARAMFAVIDRLHPELVLLDLQLPLMDGLTALRELRARDPQLKICVVTSSDRAQDINAAWAAGAHGYARKDIKLEELVAGLHAMMTGRRFLQAGLRVDGQLDPLAALSPRERDVFRLIVLGLSSVQIAVQLCISPKTAQTHRDRILGKLGLHSAVQLVRFAAVNGLLVG
jgi:two-component system response regulator FimZ (fimbrial Z protein)